MATRYDLLRNIRNITELTKTEEGYNKLIQSGELNNIHYDYGVGYYDVEIMYLFQSDKHWCRIWFGTIDDGDFGSWNECKSEESAKRLVEKAAEIFKDITICPCHKELNNIFSKIGIYFNHE